MGRERGRRARGPGRRVDVPHGSRRAERRRDADGTCAVSERNHIEQGPRDRFVDQVTGTAACCAQVLIRVRSGSDHPLAMIEPSRLS